MRTLLVVCLLSACAMDDSGDGLEEVRSLDGCPGDPADAVCDVYPDGFTCPAGSERTVIDCRPLCMDTTTCEETEPTASACPGDPEGATCDVHPDGFTCPPGSERTVIDCRPICQDSSTCNETEPIFP